MNIGGPAYYGSLDFKQKASRVAILILGFYRGWGGKRSPAAERSLIRELKQLNSSILIGQYSNINEASDPSRPELLAHADKGEKVDRENWWLRDEKGRRKRWTDQYGAWDVNIARWVKPDSEGRRYGEWLVDRDYRLFFEPIPELDLWYFDNVLPRPPVGVADWNRDGVDEKNTASWVAEEYRRAHALSWNRARLLRPGVLVIGNASDLSHKEYQNELEGVFLEALIGRAWSVERRSGWMGVMERYRAAMRDTRKPHVVGFNVWGARDDYKAMRFGLTSCLMDDGFFSFTDHDRGYRSVEWFDEFSVALGFPLSGPSNRTWKGGVYRRDFTNGVVLVNPETSPASVVLESGYRRVSGMQARDTNDGRPVTKLTLRGRDGIVLVKED